MVFLEPKSFSKPKGLPNSGDIATLRSAQVFLFVNDFICPRPLDENCLQGKGGIVSAISIYNTKKADYPWFMNLLFQVSQVGIF